VVVCFSEIGSEAASKDIGKAFFNMEVDDLDDDDDEDDETFIEPCVFKRPMEPSSSVSV
jgi:hypothetical protein